MFLVPFNRRTSVIAEDDRLVSNEPSPENFVAVICPLALSNVILLLSVIEPAGSESAPPIRTEEFISL
jgi:hypothetical protein